MAGWDCIFPYTYEDVKYQTCAADTGLGRDAPWCATEVDDEGEVVPYTWQECGDGCPLQSDTTGENFNVYLFIVY